MDPQNNVSLSLSPARAPTRFVDAEDPGVDRLHEASQILRHQAMPRGRRGALCVGRGTKRSRLLAVLRSGESMGEPILKYVLQVED